MLFGDDFSVKDMTLTGMTCCSEFLTLLSFQHTAAAYQNAGDIEPSNQAINKASEYLALVKNESKDGTIAQRIILVKMEVLRSLESDSIQFAEKMANGICKLSFRSIIIGASSFWP